MRATRIVRAIAVLTLVAAMGACSASAGGGRRGPLLSVGFITREPPPLRVEVMTERPSGEHVWIAGHWGRSGNDYAWVGGHWERPSAGYREWVDGRWEHESRGWYFVEGHWR
jgi:YXWGXW repeat-containing protein